MSRFGELINELAALNEQDLKNSAQVYGAAASLSARLQSILDNLKQTPKSFAGKKITKAEILERFGNYDRAYNAYKQAYNLKCKRGWEPFLAAIQDSAIPISLEERVTKLEETVTLLLDAWLTKV